MEITFANKHQVEIADLLWAADTQAAADEIVRKFGREAEVVRQMIVAAAFDEITDVSDAAHVLENLK